MTAFVAAQLRKELRALLPWWAAIVAAMVACWAPTQLVPVLAETGPFLVSGVIAYAVGAVTLGALSIGHEYSHHTLPTLLMQPVDRTRLLLAKVESLALMLALLGVVAVVTLGVEPMSRGPRTQVIVWLPLASGLCLAPWLTMVTRATLAGAVFSATLPVLLFPVGSYLGLPYRAVMPIILVLAAISAVMTWRTFVCLEVTGGPQAEVGLTAWLGRHPRDTLAGRTRSPVWLLVKKELRLQQMTFTVSGVFVVVWLASVVGRRPVPDIFPESVLIWVSVIHGVLVPLMTGALASAEERLFGTVEWQTLLPMAAWKQWAIKAGIAVALAFALAVVLPELLYSIAGNPRLRFGYQPPAIPLLLCLAALYVSSVSTSGVRALIATLPALAAAFFAKAIMWLLGLGATPALRALGRVLQPLVQIDRADLSWWRGNGTLWLAAGFAVLLLHFAGSNHRTADRGRRRIARQLGWFSAYAIGATLVLGLVAMMFNAGR